MAKNLPLDYTASDKAPRKSLNRVEKIIALVALAGLAPLAWNNIFRPMRGPSKQQIAAADLALIRANLLEFFRHIHRYPSTGAGLPDLTTNPGQFSIGSQMPTDPWGRAYIYMQPGSNGNPFDVYSAGPDGIPCNADDVR